MIPSHPIPSHITATARSFVQRRLVQPFGPEVEGKPYHLVYPKSGRDDPMVLAVKDWVMAGTGWVM